MVHRRPNVLNDYRALEPLGVFHLCHSIVNYLGCFDGMSPVDALQANLAAAVVGSLPFDCQLIWLLWRVAPCQCFVN